MKSRTTDVLRTVHLLALALWGGGAAFFSFLTTPRIFGFLRDSLPAAPPPGVEGITADVGRRLAGDTVGAIFPTYFAAQIIAGLLAVASGWLLARAGSRVAKVRFLLAAAALVFVTVHAFTVYPRSTRVLNEHYRAADAGDEPRAAELRQTFGILHSVSQTINLATILLVVSALGLAGLSCTSRSEAG